MKIALPEGREELFPCTSPGEVEVYGLSGLRTRALLAEQYQQLGMKKFGRWGLNWCVGVFLGFFFSFGVFFLLFWWVVGVLVLFGLCK